VSGLSSSSGGTPDFPKTRALKKLSNASEGMLRGWNSFSRKDSDSLEKKTAVASSATGGCEGSMPKSGRVNEALTSRRSTNGAQARIVKLSCLVLPVVTCPKKEIMVGQGVLRRP
jgi:hypothetical protein